MSKILGYVLVGLGSAAITGGATWYITRKIEKKKSDERCADIESHFAWQLNQCRDYYKRKIHSEETDKPEEPCNDVPLEDTIVETYDSVEEAEVENDIKGVVVREEKTYKARASEIAQEMEVQNYHKMYGEPTVETLFDDEPEEEEPVKDEHHNGPYCILKDDFWDNEDGHELVEIHLYTGDFIRKEDGEKEYLEIFYCNGYLNDRRDEDGNLIPISLDDPWRDRVIKSSEAAAIFGTEWRKWIGNDEWDSVNQYGFDYDNQDVCIRNDKLKVDFIINRIDSMYKCAIEGKEPGDPFDYDSIR